MRAEQTQLFFNYLIQSETKSQKIDNTHVYE